MRMRPDEALLLALGKIAPDRRDRAAALAAIGDPAFAWESALELARYHRVHALLAANLDDFVVPDGVRATLGRMRLSAQLRNEKYLHAVAPLLDAPLLLLKGAALAFAIYPPGTRPLNDLDLLIRRRDYPRVASAFLACGFEKSIPAPWTEDFVLRHYHEMSFVKRVGKEWLSVDLHWRIYPRGRVYRLGVEEMFLRSTVVDTGQAPVRVPSHEATFVHYATQIVNDGLYAHFGRVADLHALVASGLDWEALVATARRAGAAGAVHLALALAGLLGAHTPEAVERRLRRDCPGCEQAARILARPAFLFGRSRLRIIVRTMLAPLLFPRGRRLGYYLSLPWAPATPDRLDPLEGGAGRLRLLAKTAIGGLLLLAERVSRSAQLRRSLWTDVAAPAPKPAKEEPIAGKTRAVE